MVDATANDVLFGKIYYDDAGFPHTGKLQLIGNALVTDVVKDKTFYNFDAHVMLTGELVRSGGRRRAPPEKQDNLLELSLLLNALLLVENIKGKEKSEW